MRRKTDSPGMVRKHEQAVPRNEYTWCVAREQYVAVLICAGCEGCNKAKAKAKAKGGDAHNDGS
jgi:hypothetical protein